MWYETLLQKNMVPDFLIRTGIRQICKQRLREEGKGTLEERQQQFMQFVEQLKANPIAVETKAANEQHYEVPTRFFQLVLGRHLKYSSGYWRDDVTSLDQAEAEMLLLTVQRAELVDGQRILECGCGWGSLSLFMAAKFPKSHIVAVSNSRTQKSFIDEQARMRGLTNLEVVTSDMNEFTTPEKFDRIVSVEMFEHMRNYQALMKKLSGFLVGNGKMFIHIFTHRDFGYFYEAKDSSDWMAKYFFTGGTMPSDHLLLYFNDDFKAERHWRVNGRHYMKTSEAWLANMDRHRAEIMPLLAETYGEDNARKWWVYWRVFFMACAELWG